MAKVLLINPNIKIVDREKDHYSIMEHLGLGLLSAALKEDGHIVRILDCYAHNLSNDAAVGAFLAVEPDFVGLTANYLNFDSAVEIAELARQVLDDVYVFVGGEHCTYAAEEILARHPAIQAVVRGEGEDAVVELVRKAPKLLGVAGVYFRDVRTNTLFTNPDRPGIEDLDQLPVADRATLDYCRRRHLKTAIGVIAQRGCNFKCTFCNANKYLRLGGGSAIRRRSVKNVVDELEHLYKNYFLKGNVEKLYFYDANFIDGSNRSKAWARELALEIVRRGVVMPFEVYLRGDSLKGTDDEVVTDLKRAGLEAAFVGIESFDQQDLGFYGKDITTERLTEGLDLLRRHRVLGPTAGVIMFNPYSTVQGIQITARLLARFGYALALSTEQIFEEVRVAAPELIGITLEYNTFEEAVKLARLVKGVHPNAKVVLGGEHATYATVEILENHPEADFIVRGEGEVTFLELCELTFNGSGQLLTDVLGVAYRDESGRAVQNKDRPAIEDLDTLPYPARDTLERALNRGLRPAIAMLGSRGCPARCSFCNAYKFFNIGGGARWRPRSAASIVGELEILLKKYQGLDIYTRIRDWR